MNMMAYNADNGCGCGQLGDDCPGRRCQNHRDNPTGNAQEKQALGVLAPRKSPSTLTYDGLRSVRLWHWAEMGKARELAQRTPSGQMSQRYNDEADHHLRFVQTLNGFFPKGDTADRDATQALAVA